MCVLVISYSHICHISPAQHHSAGIPNFPPTLIKELAPRKHHSSYPREKKIRNNPLSCGCANLRLYIHLVEDKKPRILQYFLILSAFFLNSFAVLSNYSCFHISVFVKSDYRSGTAPQLLPRHRLPWIQSRQGRGQ